MKEFRCTRNAPYSHNCAGRHDITARQGYYIRCNSPYEALQQMAERFPEDVIQDFPLDKLFTVQEWEPFNVTIEEVKPDRNKEWN